MTGYTITVAPASLPDGPQDGADEMSVRDLSRLPWDGDGTMRDGSAPADIVHDNTRRAGFALDALRGYADRIGAGGSGPIEQDIRDLLSDLRHLCDAVGADFEDLTRLAASYHNSEVHGRP